MGLFSDDKITSAKGTEGGVYFLPGWYMVEIQRCKEGVTFTQKKFFVAECKILESDNPERKPGTPCTFMVTFDKYPDLSLGNVADFMRVAMSAKLLEAEGNDVPPAKIQLNQALANAIIGEDNPLAGVVLKLFAFNKPTKAKTDFTRHRWYRPSDEASDDDNAEGTAVAGYGGSA